MCHAKWWSSKLSKFITSPTSLQAIRNIKFEVPAQYVHAICFSCCTPFAGDYDHCCSRLGDEIPKAINENLFGIHGDWRNYDHTDNSAYFAILSPGENILSSRIPVLYAPMKLFTCNPLTFDGHPLRKYMILKVAYSLISVANILHGMQIYMIAVYQSHLSIPL